MTIGQTDRVRGCRRPLNRSSSHQIGNGQENTTRAPVEGADGADIIMDELGRSRDTAQSVDGPAGTNGRGSMKMGEWRHIDPRPFRSPPRRRLATALVFAKRQAKPRRLSLPQQVYPLRSDFPFLRCVLAQEAGCLPMIR